MYIEDPVTGNWKKISMKDLDFSRVCEEIVAACTDPQVTSKNLTQFALPIWIKQDGFQVLALKEVDESELSTTPLGRRRHLEPGKMTTLTKPKKARVDPQLAELSQDNAKAACMMFGDLSRTLTTVDLTQIQAAEAMYHKKGWIPPVDMLLRAREFAMRECATPQDSPEYDLWKFARSSSHDKENAERAQKLRRQRSSTMNLPDLIWSTMEAVLFDYGGCLVRLWKLSWSTMEAVLDFTLELHEIARHAKLDYLRTAALLLSAGKLRRALKYIASSRRPSQQISPK
jgi:hypothetical protein